MKSSLERSKIQNTDKGAIADSSRTVFDNFSRNSFMKVSHHHFIAYDNGNDGTQKKDDTCLTAEWTVLRRAWGRCAISISRHFSLDETFLPLFIDKRVFFKFLKTDKDSMICRQSIKSCIDNNTFHDEMPQTGPVMYDRDNLIREGEGVCTVKVKKTISACDE
jgi:hypothetical protein